MAKPIQDHNLEFEIMCAGFALPDDQRADISVKMLPEYFTDRELRSLYLRGIEHNEDPAIAFNTVGCENIDQKRFLNAVRREAFKPGYSPLPAISRLQSMWKRRKAIDLARSIFTRAKEGEVDLNIFAEEISKTEMAGTASYNDRPSEVAKEIIKGATVGMGDEERIAFGFDRLDRILRGLRRTDFLVIGGVPNTGKSPLGLTLCLRRAQLGYGHQLVVSLEMSKEQVVQALVCMHTGIPIDALTHGIRDPNRDEFIKQIGMAVEWIDENFSIIDPSIGRVTTGLVRAVVNRKRAELKQKGRELDCIFLDYLQLCGSDNKEITEWTRFIKTYALEQEIPWIVASSLNRDFARRALKDLQEGEPYTVPSMSDLRESGNVEFDATKILFLLHRYSCNKIVPDKKVVYCLKNKFGPSHVFVDFEFISKRLKFREAEE